MQFSIAHRHKTFYEEPKLNNLIIYSIDDGKAPEDCKTIFVKNLAFDSTEDEVGEFFEKCGKVENIRFVYHPY